MTQSPNVKLATKKFTVIFFGISMIILLLFVVRAPTIIDASNINASSSLPSAPDQGWTVVYAESFETDWDSVWQVADYTTLDGGEYYWAATTFSASEGKTSLWSSGGGAAGSNLTPGTDFYPNYSNSNLFQPANTVQLGENVKQVRLKFDQWLRTEESFDYLKVVVVAGNHAKIVSFSGSNDGWETKTINLDAFAQAESIHLEFILQADQFEGNFGVFLDNIVVETNSAEPTYNPDTTLFYESFEDPQLASSWKITDTSQNDFGEFTWGLTTYTASEGNQSIWASGGGADGSQLSAGSDPYPNHASTDLLWTLPIDLAEYRDVRLSFDHYIATEAGWDLFNINIINKNFSILDDIFLSGQINAWQTEVIHLDQFNTADSIYITFKFRSDEGVQDVGVFIDNIKIDGIRKSDPSAGTNRLFTPLIFVNALGSASSSCLASDNEPNDSSSLIDVPICQSQTIRGTLTPSIDPIDIYLIQHETTGQLNITLSDIPPNHNYIMTLFDQAGEVIIQNGTEEKSKRFVLENLAAGDYYLLIGFDYGPGTDQSYGLRIE